jgi:S-adenosylmethionine-diacylgycerolhomoserine-N-methlytransferase
MTDPHQKMDRMYRYQRYFYDVTRKYYLLGRDQLIAEMSIGKRDKILEIGCGTGRNLVVLARKYPDTQFYGLDASAEMLETAAQQIEKYKLRNVELRRALADEFSYSDTFGLEQEFDSAFFSYSISMIPTWRESIANALVNLKPAKSLFIVDFFDQRDLPGWFATMLQAWLDQFHVEYPDELIPHLEQLQDEDLGTLTITSLFRSYSFIAAFRKY